MKFTYPLLFLLLSFSQANGLLAQDADRTMNQIQSAFTKGSASELAVYFHTTIDLEIPGTEGSYRDKQAEIILDKFFKTHPVKSFKLNHKGASNNGSKYMIGTYSADKAYRVYVLLKLSDGKLRINTIQLEED